MAIFHLTVKVISRNQGRSVVAAAAYRSATKMTNEWDGVEHDFTKKHWVEYSEIMLPENAPPEYRDRSKLWNDVELSEKSSDARLAREVEIALPKELNRQQQIELVRTYVKDKFVDKGMIADINIHDPPVTDDLGRPIDENGVPTDDPNKMIFRNPHAHIMLTMRPLDEQGQWQPKTQKEYLLVKDGVEKAFTAEESKAAMVIGWEKQYMYSDGKKKVWKTRIEGAMEDLRPCGRSPKASRYGRQNQITEEWNSKERIYEWRNTWADMCNRTFLYLNIDEQIDSRSLADQGREDEIPTLHKSPNATIRDKRAERTGGELSDIGKINKEIKEYNRFIRSFKAMTKRAEAVVKDIEDKALRKLEKLRAKIISNEFQLRKLREFIKKDKAEYLRLKAYASDREALEIKIDESENTIRAQREALDKIPLFMLHRINDAKAIIANEQSRIEFLQELLGSYAKKYQIDEENYKQRLSELSYIDKATRKEAQLQNERKDLRSEFKIEYSKLSDKQKETFNNMRFKMDKDLLENLFEHDRELYIECIEYMDKRMISVRYMNKVKKEILHSKFDN